LIDIYNYIKYGFIIIFSFIIIFNFLAFVYKVIRKCFQQNTVILNASVTSEIIISNNENIVMSYESAITNSSLVVQPNIQASNEFKLPTYDEFIAKL
jgi:hypothetical protein